MNENCVVDALHTARVSNGMYLLTEPLLRHLGYRSRFKSANNSVKTVLRKNGIKHELSSRKEGRTIREYVQVDTNSFKHLLVLSRLPNSKKVFQLLCSMESEKVDVVDCSSSKRVNTEEEPSTESTKMPQLSSVEKRSENDVNPKYDESIDTEFTNKRSKISSKCDEEEDAFTSLRKKNCVEQKKIDSNYLLVFESAHNERQLISFVKAFCFQKFVPHLSESICRSIIFKFNDLVEAYERTTQIVSSRDTDRFELCLFRDRMLYDHVTRSEHEPMSSMFPIFVKAQTTNIALRKTAFDRTLHELRFADAEKFDFNDRSGNGCFIVVKLIGDCTKYFSKISEDATEILRNVSHDLEAPRYECWVTFSVYSKENLEDKLKEIAAHGEVNYLLLAVFVIRYKPFLFNQILRVILRRITNERFVVKNECVIRAIDGKTDDSSAVNAVAQSIDVLDNFLMLNILATICSFFM